MREAEVRACLQIKLLEAGPLITETIFEFWVPPSNERADVVTVGPRLEGFEIKTNRDSLKRLPRQAAAYGRVFDRCHAVLATRHVERAIEILPEWWGVLVVDDDLDFSLLRSAEDNYNVEPETLVRLLWRDEAYAILSELGEAPSPREGRFQLWGMILGLLEVEKLREVVRGTLQARNPMGARIPAQRFAVT